MFARRSPTPPTFFNSDELKPAGLIRHVAWRADLQMAPHAAWTSKAVYDSFQEIVASFANDRIRDELRGWEPWTGYSQAVDTLNKAGIQRMAVSTTLSVFGYPIDASERAIIAALAASAIVDWEPDDNGYTITCPHGGRGRITIVGEPSVVLVATHAHRLGKRAADGTGVGHAAAWAAAPGNRRFATTSLARGLEFAIEYIDGGGK